MRRKRQKLTFAGETEMQAALETHEDIRAQWRNEQIEITGFMGQGWHGLTDKAIFKDYRNNQQVEINIYEEDRQAIVKAGYDDPMPGQLNITIPAILDNATPLRLRVIISPDGKQYIIRRRNEPRNETARADNITALPPIVRAYQDEAEAEDAQYKRNGNGSGTKPAGVALKVARIYADIHRVEKTKGVQDNNGRTMYTVASGDDLLDMVRPIMARHNLACLPDMVKIDEVTITDKLTRYQGYYEFTLIDADSGDTWVSKPWRADVDEYRDKGPNKVSRYAMRYFLSNLFLISTGEVDDDAELSPGGPDMPEPERKSTNKKPAAKAEPKAEPKAAAFNVKFFTSNEFAVTTFWSGVRALDWQHDNHMMNALGKYAEDGTLTPDMTAEQAVSAVIRARKAKEGQS